MTLDHGVATRLRDRSLAWRLGASATAAIGVVLLTWALTVDFVKTSNNAFFGDAATYYTLGHSLATDLDFEYRRDDLARVSKEYPSGPEGLFLKRGADGRLFYAKAYIYPLVAAPFIKVFDASSHVQSPPQRPNHQLEVCIVGQLLYDVQNLVFDRGIHMLDFSTTMFYAP